MPIENEETLKNLHVLQTVNIIKTYYILLSFLFCDIKLL